VAEHPWDVQGVPLTNVWSEPLQVLLESHRRP
jgi:hypothetical protein